MVKIYLDILASKKKSWLQLISYKDEISCISASAHWSFSLIWDLVTAFACSRLLSHGKCLSLPPSRNREGTDSFLIPDAEIGPKHPLSHIIITGPLWCWSYYSYLNGWRNGPKWFSGLLLSTVAQNHQFSHWAVWFHCNLKGKCCWLDFTQSPSNMLQSQC